MRFPKGPFDDLGSFANGGCRQERVLGRLAFIMANGEQIYCNGDEKGGEIKRQTDPFSTLHIGFLSRLNMTLKKC
jgi:hypothetical protein